MSGAENIQHCTFVGIQYIICECGVGFENEESLRVHLAQKHPGRQKFNVRHLKKLPPTITEYKCGECGEIYATEEECLSHQEIDHIPFLEEVVYQDDEEDVEDSITPDMIMASSPMRKHSMSGQSVNQQPLRVQSLPTGRSQPTQEKKPKKKRPYQCKSVQCETCGKKYASNAALRYHQRVHTGVKPYKCMYCPKAFTMSLFLQIHTRTHTGEKPYQCPCCPKAFSNRAALLRHDRVHTGVKPYQCPKCLKCFTQSNSRKLHIHTVHLKLPTPYKSKRRRAETSARERLRQPAGDSHGDAQSQLQKASVEPGSPAQAQVYYELTAAAAQRQMQLHIKPEVMEAVESQEVVDGEQLMFFDVKAEALDAGEEVTYEIVYE